MGNWGIDASSGVDVFGSLWRERNCTSIINYWSNVI
jgi:hypothetical protein